MSQYRLSDFDEDGHLHDCEVGALAAQSDEVPYCGCASALVEVARSLRDFVPPHLSALVRSVEYKLGWRFMLADDSQPDGSGGLALHIISDTPDSYPPHHPIRVRHSFLVPPATYTRDTWAAWIFDRVRDVETHEAGEFFKIDGVREFGPHHGDGEDPYRVWHVSDHAAVRTKAGEKTVRREAVRQEISDGLMSPAEIRRREEGQG